MTMLTEDEAQQKWCPFSRADERIYTGGSGNVTVVASGINRKNYGGPLANCNCLASECMAWRWDPQQERHTDKRGYCGAFGGLCP